MRRCDMFIMLVSMYTPFVVNSMHTLAHQTIKHLQNEVTMYQYCVTRT